MGKNIVIFSDGTGQEGGVGRNSNVYNLFNMIEDRTDHQVSFYDRGIGTGWRKISAASGAGISRNVEEAYQFLSETFAAGDQLYLFGFSRGAATVRTLSAFLHLFGILPRSRPELFRRAWKIYKLGRGEKRQRLAEDFVLRNHTMWTSVRFLGVWDTVAALGLPFKPAATVLDWIPFFRHRFHDLRLADSVDYGRHALAIDDERRTFHPQLWDERGTRQNGAGRHGSAFSVADISDVVGVVTKLRDGKHPVSRRILPRLPDGPRKLLDRYDVSGKQRLSEKKYEELRTALVALFNGVVESGATVCDPSCEAELDQLDLPPAVCSSLQRLVRSAAGSDTRVVNRRLLEIAYSLRPRVKQVWFSGVHTDVGGGYPDSGLAHIPLLWMVHEAVELGLRVYPRHTVNLCPDPDGRLHDSRAGIGRFYRRRVRFWKPEEHQGRPPLVHESVVERRAQHKLYDPWILKAEHAVEEWPDRLHHSIQFDEERIWREDLWGWGGGFEVPWSDIERITCDEARGTLRIHRVEAAGNDIIIRGSLPRNLRPLVEKLERHREHRRLSARDKELRHLHGRLDEKVEKLKKHIRVDQERTSRLREKDLQQDEEIGRELAALKAKISEIEKERRVH